DLAIRSSTAADSITGAAIPMDLPLTRRTAMSRTTTILRSMTWALALSAAVVLSAPTPALAKTEIQWWHAMQATLGERVNEIAAKFNASQSEYEVKAIFKGSYPEAMNGAIAAYRAKQPPHIVQVYEVGTQTMLSSGAVYPVY